MACKSFVFILVRDEIAELKPPVAVSELIGEVAHGLLGMAVGPKSPRGCCNTAPHRPVSWLLQRTSASLIVHFGRSGGPGW
jgi:hypothetical protein